MRGEAATTIFDEAFCRKLERLGLLAKRLADRRAGAARRGRGVGDGLEFADHRPYAAGDDVRLVDWPYYVRMGRLLVRQFHRHSESPLAVLVDGSASMGVEGAAKFRYALCAAAAVGYVGMNGLAPLVLAPFAERLGRSLRAGRNRRNILRVLDELARWRPGGRTRLLGCVRELLAGGRAGGRPGTVILISDLLDCCDELDAALRELSGRPCDLAVIQVHNPQEARPSLAGAATLADAETGATINVQVTAELLAAYRRRWEAFQARCRRICRRRGAACVQVCTDTPLETLLLVLLRQAGVLAA